MASLSEIAKARILVIGDVMLDRYWWGTVSRISPEAPVPIVRMERSTTAAGGAANVAINIAGLGAKPLLIGVMGNDPDADSLSSELQRNGVDPAGLLRLHDRPTSVKTRIIAHSQQVVRVDSETSSALSKEHENTVWSAIEIALSNVDAVVVSDYAKGVTTPGLLEKLTAACRTANKQLFIDPKGKDYTKYRGATILTPNRREAAEACNFEESMPDVVETSGRKLVADLSLDRLLITEGEHGMTLFGGSHDSFHIDTAAKEIYDVTGAGDTVIATLAAAVCAGYDFVDAAKVANLAAGIVVQQVGTTAVTLEQLAKAMDISGANISVV